ncbi:serine endoprotease [compost metagenome]|uniref:PDZ domain-containing protein n=1 Tax=Pseudomonas promysalinigenes TaxID=485898 RepID=A0ABY6AQN6_9PSED|nr:PDZ domain-containing protein [Pseudomonas promysalinigenes]UXH40541.1 PDZ domain-containing protein [Pseudomonas promysalinigenes]
MKNKFASFALAATLALALPGCANGYKEFYTPANGASVEIIASNRASPAPLKPAIERASFAESEKLIAAYAKRGYSMIGHSVFNSGERVSEAAAIEQGVAVQADLVLIFNPQYTGSVTSSVPLTVPTTNTSYTTGSATAFGPGGSVTAYGNTSTTTYGSNTTYIPVTVNRSDYGAAYFVKMRFRFGAFLRELNDSERQALQTNQGVAVLTIVDDTPAYQADILPGDVITMIDGEKVSGTEAFNRMNQARKGKQILLSVIRQGQRIEKTVHLGN